METSKNRKSKLDLQEFEWINQPDLFALENEILTIVTDPETDFWQRTYYGFKNDNGHSFLTEIEGDFTFEVKTEYVAVNQYDQCGIMLYQDSENWVKASVEYENKQFARLGSVVTNLGFSDWASTDIPAEVTTMWYRLSRRGQDFCILNSFDGITYHQMRIFHIHHPINAARVGVYACSPLKSSFKAVFSNFDSGKCTWRDHSDNY